MKFKTQLIYKKKYMMINLIFNLYQFFQTFVLFKCIKTFFFFTFLSLKTKCIFDLKRVEIK